MVGELSGSASTATAARNRFFLSRLVGRERLGATIKQVLLIGRLPHPFATRTKQHSLERGELFLETFMLPDKQFVGSGSFFRHVLRLDQTPLALRQIIGNVVFAIHRS
jgi:hypothetical protein